MHIDPLPPTSIYIVLNKKNAKVKEIAPEKSINQTAEDKNLWNHKHTSKHSKNINSTGKWEIWQAEIIKNNHAYVYIYKYPSTDHPEKKTTIPVFRYK